MDKWIRNVLAVMGLVIIMEIATRVFVGRLVGGQIWTFISSIALILLVLGSFLLPIFWSMRLARNSALSKGIAWGQGLTYASLVMLAYNFLYFLIISGDDLGLVNSMYGAVSVIYLLIGACLLLFKKK